MTISVELSLQVRIEGTYQAIQRPKLRSQVATMIPRFIYEEYPRFSKFLEYYLEYVERVYNDRGYYDPGPYYLASNLLTFSDVDTTTEHFISYFKSQYLVDYPPLTEVETRHLLKSVSKFYSRKGTVTSFEFFFRTVFDIFFSVYYPKVDVLRLSDGKWYEPYLLRLRAVGSNDWITRDQITEMKDAVMTGLTSQATGFVAGFFSAPIEFPYIGPGPVSLETTGYTGLVSPSVAINASFSELYDWLEVNNPYRSFVPGETIKFDLPNGQVRFYWIPTESDQPEETGIQRGSGYWINQDGWISSNKYLHDNDYYQDFSYEIRTSAQLDQVIQPVRRNLHPLGFKVFARIIPEITSVVGPYGPDWQFIERQLYWMHLYNWLGDNVIPDPFPIVVTDGQNKIDTGQRELWAVPDYSMAQRNQALKEFSWQFLDENVVPATPREFEVGDFENHVLVFSRQRGKLLSQGPSVAPEIAVELNPVLNFYVTGEQNSLRTYFAYSFGTFDNRRQFSARTMKERLSHDEIFLLDDPVLAADRKDHFWYSVQLDQILNEDRAKWSSGMSLADYKSSWASRVLVFRNGAYVPNSAVPLFVGQNGRSSPAADRWDFVNTTGPRSFDGIAIFANHKLNDVIEVVILDGENVSKNRVVNIRQPLSVLRKGVELPFQAASGGVQDLLVFTDSGRVLLGGIDFYLKDDLKTIQLSGFYVKELEVAASQVGLGSNAENFNPQKYIESLRIHYLSHNADSYRVFSFPDEHGIIPTVLFKAPPKWYDKTVTQTTVDLPDGYIAFGLAPPSVEIESEVQFGFGILEGLEAYWNMDEAFGTAFSSVSPLADLSPETPPQSSDPVVAGTFRGGSITPRTFDNLAGSSASSGAHVLFVGDLPETSNDSDGYSVSLNFRYYIVGSFPTQDAVIASKKRLDLGPGDSPELAYEWKLYMRQGRLCLDVTNGVSAAKTILSSVSTIANTYYHVTVVLSATLPNRVALYVNGVLAGTVDDPTFIPTFDSTGQLTFGGDPVQGGGHSNLFRGGMTLVGIWKKALTPLEISWLYFNGEGRTFDELFYYYAEVRAGISPPGVAINGTVVNPIKTDNRHWIPSVSSTLYTFQPPAGAPDQLGDRAHRGYFAGPWATDGGRLAGNLIYPRDATGTRIFAVHTSTWGAPFGYGQTPGFEFETGVMLVSKTDLISTAQSGALSEDVFAVGAQYTQLPSIRARVFANGSIDSPKIISDQYNVPKQTFYFAVNFVSKLVWIGQLQVNSQLVWLPGNPFLDIPADPIAGTNPTFNLSEAWISASADWYWVPAAVAKWAPGSGDGSIADLLVDTGELNLFDYHYGYGAILPWGIDNAKILS